MTSTDQPAPNGTRESPLSVPGFTYLPDGTMPDQAGRWVVASGETDYAPARVKITKKGSTLMVHDKDVGVYPLDYYHGGLTGPRWARLG